jgi:hypothetical protein
VGILVCITVAAAGENEFTPPGSLLPLANVAACKGSWTLAAPAVTLSSWPVRQLYGVFGSRRADRNQQRSSGYKTKKLTPHRTLHNKPDDRFERDRYTIPAVRRTARPTRQAAADKEGWLLGRS